MLLTPKITRLAPVSVAECPPLGLGGTPSIYGKAQSHCLSTVIKMRWSIISYLLLPPPAVLPPDIVASGCQDSIAANGP